MVEATNPNVDYAVWPQVDPPNIECLQIARNGTSVDGILIWIHMRKVIFGAINPPLNLDVCE